MKHLLAEFFHKTHPYRAAFWVVSVPTIMLLGWQNSIFILFLWSTYANFAGDIAAWEASSDD